MPRQWEQEPKGPTAFDRSWPKPFLRYLRRYGVVSYAAKKAGVSKQVVYRTRKKSPKFAAAWERALDTAADRMEQEAIRRAVDGYDRPVYQKGELVGYERVYSDQLMQTVLRAHKPEKYKDRMSVEYAYPPEMAQLMQELNVSSAELFEHIIKLLHAIKAKRLLQAQQALGDGAQE